MSLSDPRSALQFLVNIASTVGLAQIRHMGGAELQYRHAVLQFDSAGSCDFRVLPRLRLLFSFVIPNGRKAVSPAQGIEIIVLSR